MNERAAAAGADHTPLLLAIAACAASRRAVIVGAYSEGEDRGVNNPAALTDQSLRWELTPLAQVCGSLWSAGHSFHAAQVGVWLAAVLRLMGRYAEAARCLQLTPASDAAIEDGLGYDFSGCYSNLALIQKDQGDLPGARASMERAIEIDSKHFAPDHPTFAIKYNNLATTLQALGHYADALRYKELSMQIERQHLGEEHPQMGASYSNFATIQHDLGDLPGARASMERAIEIKLKHFAPDHPNLAISYNNLAHIAVAQGRIPEAVALWRRSYPIRLKALGPDHPYTKGDAAMLRKYDPPGP